MKSLKKFLRLPDVLDRTGLKRSTFYLKIKEGTFPAPVSLGERAVAWNEDDVDEWMEERIKKSKEKGGKK